MADLSGHLRRRHGAGSGRSPAARHRYGGGKAPARVWAGRRLVLWVTVIEYAGFAAAIIGTALADQFRWSLVLCALISGAHFLVIARVVERRAAIAKGVLLIAIALLTVLLVPSSAMLGGHQLTAWIPVAGWASAVVLWADAAVAIVRGQLLIRLQPAR